MSEFIKEYSHDTAPEEYHALLDLFVDPADKLLVLSWIQKCVLLETQEELAETQDEKEFFEAASTTDHLTQLDTAAIWYAELNKSLLKHPDNTAVIDIDFTNFKYANDTLGKVEGNRIIAFIGRKFGEKFRASDNLTVARLGGDEIGILADMTPNDLDGRLTKMNRLRILLERVQDVINSVHEEWPKLRDVYHMDIAFGAAIADFDDDAESLVKKAEAKMKEMKAKQHELLGQYRTPDLK